jgi:hypothetical protein
MQHAARLPTGAARGILFAEDTGHTATLPRRRGDGAANPL